MEDFATDCFSVKYLDLLLNGLIKMKREITKHNYTFLFKARLKRDNFIVNFLNSRSVIIFSIIYGFFHRKDYKI
jgi:hypothetical protein